MGAVWNPATVSAGEFHDALSLRRALAPFVVAGGVLYNFVLCFVNTRLFGISDNLGIAIEIVLVGTSLVLIWDCSSKLYALLLLIAAYFVAVMALRQNFDPKIVRDVLIPVVFYALGRYLGAFRSADRLVTVLLAIAFVTSIWEWLAPGIYLRFFDVVHYYIARGTLTGLDTDVAPGLFFNGTRYDGRALLPFLGDERMSGMFLEPPSVGNFGVIVFAWLLLRDRQHILTFVVKTVAVLSIIVLADARFGLYFGILTVLLYFATPLIRPTMLLVAPFLFMIALIYYAGIHWQEVVDNSMSGRFVFSGTLLSSLDLSQVFGLEATDVKSGAGFATNNFGDSGYSYMLVTVGLAGVAALWALFVYMPARNPDAARFKNFVAFYFILLLSISSAVFTIKTAALLWFLLGTLNNPTAWLGTVAPRRMAQLP
jgi:putative polymerase